MKSGIQFFSLLLVAVMLTACSPRVAQPPPLEELEAPMDDNTYSESSGPRDFGDPDGLGTADWGNEFEGDEPVSTSSRNASWGDDPSLQTIYFDYNRYELSAEARDSLLNNVEYLRRNPTLRVLVEGHCDERGTEEYNQALGENRALAVREYLIQLGISPSRIDILSYGELMPSVEGHNESAFRWNRRAAFKVASR